MSVKDDRILKISSVEDMFEILKDKGRALSSFKKGDTIEVWNRMEKGSYVLTESPGEGFAEGFKPYLTPGEILSLGAFGGKYLNDCLLEFPAEWFWNAGLLGKLCPGGQDINVNYFKIDSRLPLSEWRKSGWVPGGKKLTGKRAVLSIKVNPQGDNRGKATNPQGDNRGKATNPQGDNRGKATNPDIRGWFQWYCRYWMGRRIPELDAVQIQRWKNFIRHYGAVKKACGGDLSCRPRQRQALLHWAWPFD